MKQLQITPLILLLAAPIVLLAALATLVGCQQESKAGNDVDTSENQKPISPAKPTE